MSSSPYAFVRVSTDEGEFTTSRATAEAKGLRIVDKPAVDHAGKPLPAKPRTNKAGQSPAPRDTNRLAVKGGSDPKES